MFVRTAAMLSAMAMGAVAEPACADAAVQEQTAVPLDSVDAILARFADDYAGDASLTQDITFGVFVGPEHWYVVASAAEEGRAAAVTVHRGVPPEPVFYFQLGYETLVAIDRGDMNALTAMVRGLASDPALMGTGAHPGFQPGPGFTRTMLDLSFHFWTRGTPEIIPFGEDHTRMVHGADAVVLYYEPGFRSGWFNLQPGQHANADPRLQVNPFPTLLIITEGVGRGRIGGRELELGSGHAVLIPAGVSHEFWNPFEAPVRGFLIMFGEGA
jgi:mannose-6-phosphate isomerase-like protein (cupin superfamily)